MANRSARAPLKFPCSSKSPTPLRALPGLDYQFARAGVQPAPSLRDQLLRRVRSEGAAVLLAQLELHFEPPRLGHR